MELQCIPLLRAPGCVGLVVSIVIDAGGSYVLAHAFCTQQLIPWLSDNVMGPFLCTITKVKALVILDYSTTL
ncbi:hypothetical protein DENSPDRAFT_842668 [Dentipellis sp. KUC8613]|nr:hypothetical protein DENSPDRAFT_842668 [Dentipellis sp. KUC8613]